MQGNRDREFVAVEDVAPRCDGCGRVGVAYRLSVTNLQRPFAPHHRHYCACCWDTLRTGFAEEPQGAATAVEDLGAGAHEKGSELKLGDVPAGAMWKDTAMQRRVRE